MTSLRSAGQEQGQAATPDPAERRDRRMDDSRGGFVLKARSDEPPVRRRSLVERSGNIKRMLSVSKKKEGKQRKCILNYVCRKIFHFPDAEFSLK